MSEALLEHYRTTLAKIRETGFLAYGTRQLSPYVSAALKVFSSEQKTITEDFVRKQTRTLDPTTRPESADEPG